MDNQETIKKKIEQFSKLANEINELWQNIQGSDDFLIEEYPFESSFDEMVADIENWNESIQKNKKIYRVGLREVWEQMYEVEASSMEEAEDMIRQGEGILEDQLAFVDIDHDNPFTYYSEPSGNLGFSEVVKRR